jgi:hypothetical protein
MSRTISANWISTWRERLLARQAAAFIPIQCPDETKQVIEAIIDCLGDQKMWLGEGI